MSNTATIMYLVNHATGSITPVAVVRYNERSVWLSGDRGKFVATLSDRRARFTKSHEYHATVPEAKEALVERIEGRLEYHRQEAKALANQLLVAKSYCESLTYLPENDNPNE